MPRKNIFDEVKEFTPKTMGEYSADIPILYRRLDSFFAAYTAYKNEVLEIMPSERLSPITPWPGRAMVVLTAFNYFDTSIGAYGEFSVGAPCFIRHQGKLLAGMYIHRLPVTEDIARVGGIELWGYPKFLAEMEFENTGEAHGVRMSEGGKLVLELRVNKAGAGFGMTLPISTFTVKEGDIIHTRLMTQATLRPSVQGLARLRTGEHWMGEELAGLGLSARPVLTGDFLDANLILPQGENIGPA